MALFATRRLRVVLAVTVLLIGAAAATLAVVFRARHFDPDPALEERTYVAPSTIPGAGDGLFAARDLKKGEVIAEMGGEPVFEATLPAKDRGYLFKPPACAMSDVWPYDALDGRNFGGRGSKINFAPRLINGVETGFQNARGKEMCRRPYIYFEATRDIPKGTEVLTSYGEDYDYDFMAFATVREHFCAAAKVDCSGAFEWKP